MAIAPTSVTKPVEQPVQPSTPSSGTYTFKERSSIKAEPSVASPELAYYDTGMSVNYDRLVTADGHTWLSYVSHGATVVTLLLVVRQQQLLNQQVQA